MASEQKNDVCELSGQQSGTICEEKAALDEPVFCRTDRGPGKARLFPRRADMAGPRIIYSVTRHLLSPSR